MRLARSRATREIAGGLDSSSPSWMGHSKAWNSGEIVSPVLGYDDIDELQNVVRAVRTAGAKADPSTGIHIHIDGSRFDAKSVTNLVKLVHKQERLLEHALGVSETRLSRYCRPINASFIQRLEARRPKTMQEVSDAWYGYRNTSPQRYDQTRYYVALAIMWRSVPFALGRQREARDRTT